MASKKPVDVVRKVPTRTKAVNKFPTATGHKGVQVTPGAGGAGRIGPDHCTSKRAAGNVKSSYTGSGY